MIDFYFLCYHRFSQIEKKSKAAFLQLVFVMLSRLFIAALWSPAGKRVDLLALVYDV